MSGKTKFRLVLLLALAGVCGYVGYLIFQERDPLIPQLAAENAYKAAQDLEKKKDFKPAAEKYDQAYILLEHAFKRLNGPHGFDSDKVKEISGKVLFMKAMALRDKHYALAAAAGKPLPETKDSVTNQNYRNVMVIPDAKDREEAVGSIRGATSFGLSKDYDVHLEALRLELIATPIQWDQVEKLAKAILEIKKDDSRAKYLLAKYEFDQPEPGKNFPTDPIKRSPDRIKIARRYIEEVKSDPTFPIWRTEYLNNQIHFWLMNRARYKRETEFNTELAYLEQALLDDRDGAVPRIRRGEGMDHAMSWDVEAVLALHALAADMAVEIIRKKNLQDYSSLARVFRDTLAFSKDQLNSDDPKFTRPMLISVLLNLMTKSQSFLATQADSDWQVGLSMLRPLLTDEFNNDHCDPYRVAQFAELLMREAQMQRARELQGQPAVASKTSLDLAAEAKKWLDDGMKYGKDHNLSNLQMMPFNMLAANIFYFNTDKRENLIPFLAALEVTKNPQAQALALVIDGAVDEREGRLEKARWKLEGALKIPGSGGEEEVRAHASLANIFMAMGMPDHALVSLNSLRDVYERYKDLSDLEKQWIGQFLRGPQDFYALIAIANLESARKAVEAFHRKNPTAKSFPAQLVQEREDRVRNLLKKDLPRQSGPGFMTRVSWINYLTATRRRQLAEDEWQDLNKDYSGRLELLTLRVGLTQIAGYEALEAGDVRRAEDLFKSIDYHILKFIEDHNGNPSARLYFALWLAQTKRVDQARQYLSELPETLKGTPEYRRVLAAVMLSHNSENSPMRLVKHMPRDPQIDNVLVGIAKNIEVQQAEVRKELTRYEANGISLVMQAEDLLAKEDYERAAEAFAVTLDFTRIKAMAQQGVIRSMFALAAKDSDKALQLVQKLVFDYPKEPALLLVYAYIFLLRDEIGAPTDTWILHRNMGSALNVWEQHMKDESAENYGMIALTQAEFWFRANRMDVAREQTQRALKYEPKNPKVLVACIDMILDDPAHELRPELRRYVDDLKRLAADAHGPEPAMILYLSGRVEEFEEKWDKAAYIYEESLKAFPKDRTAYARLIGVLERGNYARALEWARKWRVELPNDLQALSAEVRLLCRQNQVDAARKVGDDFLQKSLARAGELARERIKDPKPAVQEEIRAKFLESMRLQGEFELAKAFYLGGAWDEAEKRIQLLPKDLRNAQITQEMLGEIYIKKNEFGKAEKVFETLVENNRSDLAAVNNLAYLLTDYLKQPSKARDILLTAIKGNGAVTSRRAADRFPPEFLATVGKVYMVLDNPAYGKEMLDFFKTAGARYPSDPRVLLYLGYAYELTGETASAEIYVNKALKNFNRPGLSSIQRDAVARDAETIMARLKTKVRPVPVNLER